MDDEAGAVGAAGRPRQADLLLLLLLFAALTALSWRRWASFDGDLNREWTTPARVAAGERLYRDVSYYYGPLVPWTEGAAFRLLGARVGTAVGFGLLAALGTLLALQAGARRFLPPAGRLAVASTAAGVFAFAPENGAFPAPYSLAALLAVGLAWASWTLARKGRDVAASVAAGLALLSKVEALPALLFVGLALGPRRRLRFAAVALGIAAAGYAWALRGLPVDELVRYGPLRHAALPPEFRELYLRVAGLHPALLPGALHGLLAGSLLLGGFLAGLSGLLARRPLRAAAGAAGLLSGALLWLSRAPEPLLTTLVRGLPALLLAAFLLALLRARQEEDARQAALAAGIGLSFAWRTALWTVPSFPYAPLAIVSALPAVAWLAASAAPRAVPQERRRTASALLCLPLVLSPLAFLPRLVDFYASPREAVEGPRGRWLPPGEDGALYQAVLDRLRRLGVTDRSLVVVPEATALGFLLGVRSPLRLEQLLPGHLDDAADRDTAHRLEETRPKWVVVLPRATAEYAGSAFGVDHGRRTAGVLSRDYVPVTTFRLARDPSRSATLLTLAPGR